MVDPTRLTTEALNREIASVREVIEQQIDAVREVQHERSLRIAQQFESVENQRKEQKQDTQKAVDAALAAQKEAVKEQTLSFEKATEKSERSINDLLTQLRNTVTKDIELLREQVGEVKTSVTAMQNQRLGAKDDRTGLYASIAAFAGLLGIAGLIVAFVAK